MVGIGVVVCVCVLHGRDKLVTEAVLYRAVMFRYGVEFFRSAQQHVVRQAERNDCVCGGAV